MTFNIGVDDNKLDMEGLLREWRQLVENSLPNVIPVIRNNHLVSIMDSIVGVQPMTAPAGEVYRRLKIRGNEPELSGVDEYLERIGV